MRQRLAQGAAPSLSRTLPDGRRRPLATGERHMSVCRWYDSYTVGALALLVIQTLPDG